jgi:predicted transcriptional regulator
MSRTDDSGVIGRAERTAVAIKMRCAGYGYERIAETLNVKPGTVKGYLKEYLADLKNECTETANEMRQIENMRLASLFLALKDGISDGDPRAIAEARAISASIRKMNGLDASEKQELAVTASPEMAQQLTDLAFARVRLQQADEDAARPPDL